MIIRFSFVDRCARRWRPLLTRAWVWFLASCYGLTLQAQLEFRPIDAPEGAPPQVRSFALDRNRSEFQVTERGRHHEVFERVVSVTDEQGQASEQVHRYTQLGDNLHYWDKNLSDWVKGEAVIEPTRGGAIARKGAQQVKFPRQLNVRGGVRIRSSDGNEHRANVLGLVYRHGPSGHQVSIATVRQSLGELLPPNQVIYRDAFEGVRADVLYEYKLSGVVQDVILREQLPPPTDFGFASSDGVLLEVVTEWFTDAEVEVTESEAWQNSSRANPGVVDHLIRIGTMGFDNGIGFPTQSEQPLADSFAVSKRWVDDGDRKLLYEAVELAAVGPILVELPSRSGRPAARNSLIDVEALPAPVLNAVDLDAAPIAVGVANVEASPGLTIDYATVDYETVYEDSNRTNRRFRTGETYVMATARRLSGHTIFEGGAIIKLNAGTLVNVEGTHEFQSTPNQPVIFTSVLDHSVGTPIPDDSGSPVTILSSSTGFYSQKQTNVVVENAVFRYLNTAIFIYHGSGHVIRNVRVDHVNTAVGVSSKVIGATRVENALFDEFGTGLNNTQGDFIVSNLTAHDGDRLASSSRADLRNSLIVDVRTIPNYENRGELHNVERVSLGGVFQTVGGGRFYLAEGSLYRDRGTDPSCPEVSASEGDYLPANP